MKKCLVCDKVGDVKTCSKCDTACYCNAACQAKHWPTHKLDCYNTVTEANTIVDRIVHADKTLFKQNMPGRHCAIWITLNSLSDMREYVKTGIFRSCRGNAYVPNEWNKIYPLSMIQYDIEKHIVVLLQVKRAAKKDEYYQFAFAIGRNRQEDDTISIHIDKQSGNAMFTIKRAFMKDDDDEGPAIVISY